MRAEEVKKAMDRRPFRPFRLCMSSGERVEIRHPEIALVTREWITVAVGHKRIPDYSADYNLIHVVKIEPINGRGGATGKSAKTKRK